MKRIGVLFLLTLALVGRGVPYVPSLTEFLNRVLLETPKGARLNGCRIKHISYVPVQKKYVAIYDTGLIAHYDPKGKLLKTFSPIEAKNALDWTVGSKLSPDGKWVAYGNPFVSYRSPEHGSSLPIRGQVWNTETGKLLGEIPAENVSYRGIFSFSPDSKFLVTQDSDKGATSSTGIYSVDDTGIQEVKVLADTSPYAVRKQDFIVRSHASLQFQQKPYPGSDGPETPKEFNWDFMHGAPPTNANSKYFFQLTRPEKKAPTLLVWDSTFTVLKESTPAVFSAAPSAPTAAKYFLHAINDFSDDELYFCGSIRQWVPDSHSSYWNGSQGVYDVKSATPLLTLSNSHSDRMQFIRNTPHEILTEINATSVVNNLRKCDTKTYVVRYLDILKDDVLFLKLKTQVEVPEWFAYLQSPHPATRVAARRYLAKHPDLAKTLLAAAAKTEWFKEFEERKIDRYFLDLGHDRFVIREKASKELKAYLLSLEFPDLAVARLKSNFRNYPDVKHSRDAEIDQRLNQMLSQPEMVQHLEGAKDWVIRKPAHAHLAYQLLALANELPGKEADQFWNSQMGKRRARFNGPFINMSERIKTYAEFWQFYLQEHSKPLTRRFHVVGAGVGLLIFIAALYTQKWLLIPAAFGGYAFAWFSHFFVEKNRPATFKYPYWSFISEFRMVWLTLRGRL